MRDVAGTRALLRDPARAINRARALTRHPMRRAELRGQVMRPLRVRRFHHFGTNSFIDRPAFLFGEGHMSIGDDVVVLRGGWFSVEEPAQAREAPALRIGDRVGFRPYCVVSVAESVTIEDDVVIGSFTCIIDSAHTFDAGNPNIMHNPVRAEPVRIGRGTWLAERVAVLPGADIGRCCMVGANSVVRGRLPDFSIALGIPARVIGKVEGVDPDRPPPTHRLW
jgi:acetyltransferase-like isoleucine patch superfamily enzyme